MEVEVLRHQSVGCAAWLRAASLGAVSELRPRSLRNAGEASRARVADKSQKVA
jgi:hypothetical protein